MGLWRKLFGTAQAPGGVRNAGESITIYSSPEELEAFFRRGSGTASGQRVTEHSAMRVAAVYACVRIIAGAVATLPLHVKRRVDYRTREDASDTQLWKVLRRRPNRWQTPSQFRRMQQAHILLRGNAYSLIVRSRGEIIELLPLHPDRVRRIQNDDLSLSFVYTRKDGRQITFQQNEILDLVGLTLDGVNGVSVLTFARESIGEALATAQFGAAMFKNGARVSGVLRHPKTLTEAAAVRLRESVDDFRANESKDQKIMILEEGMEFEKISLSSVDAQWIEARKFSRSEIAMFFGVPPHMIGDTEKSTSWGTGIEQQSIGFVNYTLEDHLTMWEEAINRDLVSDQQLYARFNRKALLKGDIKTRKDFYVGMLQWGVYSPNKVLELEDENPRPGGDIWYPPPNTAGQANQDGESSKAPKEPGDDDQEDS